MTPQNYTNGVAAMPPSFTNADAQKMAEERGPLGVAVLASLAGEKLKVKYGTLSSIPVIAPAASAPAPTVAAPAPAVTGAPVSVEEEVIRLRQENARLQAIKQGKASLKISVAGTNEAGQVTKGGSLCISGIRRFPFAFDYSDIVTIFGDPFVEGSHGMVEEIKAFAKANRRNFRAKTV